jgi:putative GTP pyrophosphokinase
MPPEIPDIVQLVSQFADLRPRYARFSKKVCELIETYCPPEDIHTTECRAKDIQSFRKKCAKTENTGRLRYEKPLDQITDLAGVRIIVFMRESVDIVCEKIGEILEIIEIEDVGERVYLQGKFGYQSKHLLIRIGADRSDLFDYKEFAGLTCEIQVRTILQHAWAEMEHDIQYKSDDEIPLDLKKRFSALAGLLELADREFQNIQRDSRNLRQTVRNDLITDLTQQRLAERAPDEQLDRQANQTVAARDLIEEGRYSEAVEIYSDKIDDNPNNYTLYLGRSKARFLAGDVRGAVEDINRADDLSGKPEYTVRMRSMMESGDNPRKLLKSATQIATAEKLNEALDAIRRADGVVAFEAYNSIESGVNRGLVAFGRAMACCLELDPKGASAFLDTLEARPATAMAVNIWALKAVSCAISGEEIKPYVDKLEAALAEMPTYSFRVSPLSAFYEGFCRKNYEQIQSQVQPIFDPLVETDRRPDLGSPN